MKQTGFLIALLALCTTLSGCFGIEEKVLIHKDGSGVFTYTIDMTKMMTEMMSLIEGLKGLGKDKDKSSSQEEEPATDLRSETIAKMKEDVSLKSIAEMNSLKGISGAREFTDTTDGKFVMGISFNFANVTALNNGLKTMLNKKEKTSKEMPAPIYSFKKGILTRELTKGSVEGLVGSDKDDELVKNMLKDFKYVVVIESDDAIKTAAASGADVTTKGNITVINYQLFEKNKEIVKSKMRSETRVY